MELFKADLFRSFAIGFGLGALLVVIALAPDWSVAMTGDVVPAASAAPAR